MNIAIAELEDWAKNITFRDWRIQVLLSVEGPMLCVLASVLDSRQSEDTTLDIHSHIPPLIRSEGDFYVWVLWRLNIIATHEVAEDFLVSGTRFLDPHAPDYLLPPEHRDSDPR